MTTTVGLEEIKNAAVTLHPQSAAEHLHHLFVAGGGEQSDALMVMEAAEMPATRTDRKLVPVRAAEPLAGAPDRSPIPLADPLVGAASAVQGGARVAREAMSGAAAGAMEHLTDLLPRRRTSYRRVVPLADRTASQRRLAIAFLGFLVLLVALAGVVWFIGGLSHPNVAAVSNAQQAIQAATDDMAQVTDGNLLVNEPTRAHTILQDAWHQLTQATAFGAPAVGPGRPQGPGLDRARPALRRRLYDARRRSSSSTRSTPTRTCRASSSGPMARPTSSTRPTARSSASTWRRGRPRSWSRRARRASPPRGCSRRPGRTS